MINWSITFWCSSVDMGEEITFIVSGVQTTCGCWQLFISNAANFPHSNLDHFHSPSFLFLLECSSWHDQSTQTPFDSLCMVWLENLTHWTTIGYSSMRSELSLAISPRSLVRIKTDDRSIDWLIEIAYSYSYCCGGIGPAFWKTGCIWLKNLVGGR